MTFGSIPSRLLSPVLAERMEGRTLMSAVLLLQGLGIVGFLISHDLWALYAVATLFGVAYGGEATVYPVINRRYFGRRPLSGIHGRQLLGALVGQSLSVAAAGLIIDHFGEVPGFTLGIALNFAGAALVWTMESTRNVLVTVEDGPDPGEVAPGRCLLAARVAAALFGNRCIVPVLEAVGCSAVEFLPVPAAHIAQPGNQPVNFFLIGSYQAGGKRAQLPEWADA